MDIAAADLTPGQIYKVLTSTVMPRPIALVSTLNADGGVNAAPFSFFNIFSEAPPLLVGDRRGEAGERRREEGHYRVDLAGGVEALEVALGAVLADGGGDGRRGGIEGVGVGAGVRGRKEGEEGLGAVEDEARDLQVAAGYGKDPQIVATAAARRYLGDRLTRVVAPHRLLSGDSPLIAVRLWILTRKSLGGLETDLSGRVLTASGDPLPGVYAAGEVSGFGGGGVHGYRALEGTFLGGCVFSGRVAGRAAAAAVG